MAVHGRLAVVVAFVLTSISTVVVALRFYSRYFLVGKLGSPDWVMLAALLATWSSAVINFYVVHFLNYSHVHDKDSFAEVVVGNLLFVWIYRINYIASLCLIKTSILLFYNYVASSHKSFHRIVRGMIAIVVVASFAMMIAGIFSCNPPSDAWSFDVFWNGFLGIHADQCYNPTLLWLFNAGFNLVTDTFIWILPIPFLLNLQSMPVRRRFELIGIFSIGIMAIVASSIRLWVIVLWLSDWQKQGENTANLMIWSQVEQHAGIISASIPFLRPLLRKAFSAARSERLSPSPAAKLIAPVPQRTPIIPSPSPTFGSTNSPFRPPRSPLVPISP
ncbi:hypothetical protein K505DRAFT_195992, partial [Melanomma pulvis-pyrius CBS 109.77]